MKSNINVRINSDIKAEAVALFEEMGMDMTTAINIFIRQVIANRCLPFPVQAKRLKPSVMEAIDEIDNNKENLNTYANVDELMEQVEK